MKPTPTDVHPMKGVKFPHAAKYGVGRWVLIKQLIYELSAIIIMIRSNASLNLYNEYMCVYWKDHVNIVEVALFDHNEKAVNTLMTSYHIDRLYLKENICI